MTIAISQEKPSLNQLPKTFLIALTQLSAIKLEGEEQSKYLQGQVTCDVNAIDEQGLLIGAHCDAKGKVFNVFRLLNRFSHHLLIQNDACLTASLAELNKFGVFAKVDITQASDLCFYALVGEEAKQLIQSKFDIAPDSLNPVVQSGNTTIVYIASDEGCSVSSRYILIDSENETKFITTLESLGLPCFNSTLWDLLEITQGFPQLSAENSGQYVPQMLNLQAIKGISFTKGCYLGQETVARMQYLGKNKRALFSLNGSTSAPITQEDAIEKQLGENWRKAGDILSTYQSDNGDTYIQAVLSSDLYESENIENALRLKSSPESLFNISQLPYNLAE
ncbi:MAG: tRNA-modifying protein YgfZ [Colwellia sp.]